MQNHLHVVPFSVESDHHQWSSSPLPLAPGYLFTRNFNPYWWGRWMLFGCGLWCDLCQIVEVWFWEVPPHLGASQVELEVKNLPANAGDTSFIFGSGRSSEVGNGNPLHYSCLEIPWTEEPGRPQSMGLQRVGHDWAQSPFLTEEMEENTGDPEGEFDLKKSTGSLLLPAIFLQPQVEVELCP